MKDPRLVHDLRRGRQPGAAMEKRVREYLATSLSALPDSDRKQAALRRLRQSLRQSSHQSSHQSPNRAAMAGRH